MDFKDYYSILGVPKGASHDEIRKAYRKLARQYHPDVAKDKARADQKFKEINEAYEVLGDEGKRRKYDELGSNWNRSTASQPPPQWQQWGQAAARGGGSGRARSFKFEGTGFSDFFEEFFGSGGGGFAGFGGAEPAHATGSRGGADFHEFSVRGGDVEGDIAVTLEEVLQGSVREVSMTRQNRQGGEQRETFKVRIPPGVREGQRLRVPGKGDSGMGGGGPGDLFLNVRLAPHPLFKVQGSDLVHEVDVAPWEAVLGSRVKVPTLDGRVTVRIPPGSQSGTQLRVRGRGLPAGDKQSGDLLLTLNITVPDEISDSERRLWEQLAEVSDYHPRG